MKKIILELKVSSVSLNNYWIESTATEKNFLHFSLSKSPVAVTFVFVEINKLLDNLAEVLPSYFRESSCKLNLGEAMTFLLI